MKRIMEAMLLFVVMLALASGLLLGVVAVASGAEIEDVTLYVTEPDEGEIVRTFDEELGVYCYETDEGSISCLSVCDLGCNLECPDCDPCETPTPPPDPTPTPPPPTCLWVCWNFNEAQGYWKNYCCSPGDNQCDDSHLDDGASYLGRCQFGEPTHADG